MRRTIPIFLTLLLLASGATTHAAPPTDTKAKTKVAQIVFVGKKHACPCTQKSIDAGRKALQAVLGNKSRYRLLELNFDVDADRKKIDDLREKQAFTGLPAIYFLDGAGSVKQLLQGDITEAQVRAVLK